MKKLFLLLILLAGMSQAQTTVAPFLTSNPQFFTTSGLPNSGGCVFTYSAGTLNALATYSESTGTSLNSNPILLNSAGFATSGGIWFASPAYKVIVKTAGGTNCSTGSVITTSDGITWSTPLSTFAGLISTGDVTLQQSTAATSGANQSSNNLKIQGTYWTGVVSANDTWTLQDILGAGSNPTSTLTLTHSGSSGAATFSVPGNQTVGGTLGVTGNITCKKFELQRCVDSANTQAWAGADMGAWINSAVADCVSGTPCTILVGDGGGTLSTTVQLGKLHRLRFGAGTYNIKQILLADSTTDTTGVSSVEGCGRQCTTLFRIASTNLDMISDTNFGTLTGTASTFGVFRARIANLTLDGNKANNATGYGIRIFGRAFSIEFVTDQNQPTGGMWTEGTQAASFNATTSDQECSIIRVTDILSGGNGMTFKGPNDCSIYHFVAWGHAAWGTQYFGAAHVFYENDFVNGSGGMDLESGGFVQCSGCQLSAAVPAGFGLLVNTGAGNSQFSNTIVANNGGVCMEVKASGINFQGVIENCTTGIEFNTAASNAGIYNVTFNNVTGNQINWNGVGGNNFINASGTGPGGCVLNGGTPASNSTIISTEVTCTGTPSMQFANPGTIVTGGWTQTIPTGANSTFALLGLQQNYTALQTFASNKAIVTGSDFTTSSATLVTITGLTFTLPAIARNYSFHCSLAYSQATAAAANSFGIQAATNSPTNIMATSHEQITVGPPATFVDGVLATLASTTATVIGATFTPGAIGTNYTATLDGAIENPASANTINIMVLTGNASDAISVKRGSYCELW